MQWKPKLHPNPTQSFDAVGPARAGGVGSCARESNEEEIYQTIFHNDACHEILYLGGCHLSNTICNRSTRFSDDDEDTSTSNAAYESEPERIAAYESEPECMVQHKYGSFSCTEGANNSSGIRGAPSVSQKWADMAHRSHEQLSDTEIMLLQSVRAEFLFADGPGGTGGQEHTFKIPSNPLKPFKLVPTSFLPMIKI